MILEIKIFIILSKIEQSFLYIEVIPQILSCLKKPAKNHNNHNKKILTKLNIFLYSIITSSHMKE